MKKYIYFLLVGIMLIACEGYSQNTVSVTKHRTGKTYRLNDLVSHNGVIYRSLVQNSTTPPSVNWVNISTTAGSGAGNINDGSVVGAIPIWNGTSWVETPYVVVDGVGDVTVTESITASNLTGVNTGDQNATTTPFTPAGNTSSDNVQLAIQELQTNIDAITGEVDPIFTAEENDILKVNEAKTVTSRITYDGQSAIPLVSATSAQIDAIGDLATVNRRFVAEFLSGGGAEVDPIFTADKPNLVQTTGNQTVNGIKTFSSPISGVDGVASTDLVTKSQLDAFSSIADGVVAGSLLEWSGTAWVENTTAGLTALSDFFIDNDLLVGGTIGATNLTGSNLGDQIAVSVPFTPTGNTVAPNVQDAIVEIQTELDGAISGAIADGTSLGDMLVWNGSDWVRQDDIAITITGDIDILNDLIVGGNVGATNLSGSNTGDQNASQVVYTPTGNTTSTNVQSAITEIQTELDGAGDVSTTASNKWINGLTQTFVNNTLKIRDATDIVDLFSITPHNYGATIKSYAQTIFELASPSISDGYVFKGQTGSTVLKYNDYIGNHGWSMPLQTTALINTLGDKAVTTKEYVDQFVNTNEINYFTEPIHILDSLVMDGYRGGYGASKITWTMDDAGEEPSMTLQGQYDGDYWTNTLDNFDLEFEMDNTSYFYINNGSGQKYFEADDIGNGIEAPLMDLPFYEAIIDTVNSKSLITYQKLINYVANEASSGGGGIGGSIADEQIAFGNGTDITGSPDLTYETGNELINRDGHIWVTPTDGSVVDKISATQSTLKNAISANFASTSGVGLWAAAELTAGTNAINIYGINGFGYLTGASSPAEPTGTPFNSVGGRYATRLEDTANGHTVVGASGFVDHGGSGTVVNAYAFLAEKPVVDTGNTITNYANFKAITNAVDGTITNYYGMYIDELTAGSNNWGIYTAGATESYFGGKVQVIGDPITGDHVGNRDYNDLRYAPIDVSYRVDDAGASNLAYDAFIDDWTLSTGITHNSHEFDFATAISQFQYDGDYPFQVVNGAEYLVTINVSVYSAGTMSVSVGGGTPTGAINSSGSHQIRVTASSGSSLFNASFPGAFTGSIDHISVTLADPSAGTLSDVTATGTNNPISISTPSAGVKSLSYSHNIPYIIGSTARTITSDNFSGSMFINNTASSLALTVNGSDSPQNGQQVSAGKFGTGNVVITPTNGATINGSTSAVTIITQYAGAVTLIHMGGDDWYLIGTL